jgi:hypothetical protein
MVSGSAFGGIVDIYSATAKAITFMTQAGVPAGSAFIFMANGAIGGYALFEERTGIYSLVG